MTRLLKTLGLARPVIQAPIGNLVTPALVAAVSNAGGLGMLAGTWVTPQVLEAQIRRVRQLTGAAFGVNFVLEWRHEDRLEVCFELSVPVISTFWGDPRAIIRAAHRRGAMVCHTVGTTAEALEAADAGVDVVVAQGWEAGGHVVGTVATMALLPAVVDAVGDTPVVAAGGIADGRGLAAALALGAQAAWMGTRFVASEESAAHALYKRRIVDADETETVYSSLFDGGWPGAPHRTLRNATVAAWERAGRPPPGERPGEGTQVARTASGEPVWRYSDTPPRDGIAGNVDAMALYAGQSAALVRSVLPAATIVAQTAADAEARL